MTGSDAAGRAAHHACGFALIAVAVGCQPRPVAATPSAARWRAEAVCRVHQRYVGANDVADHDYQLAADGSTLEIELAWRAGHSREVFLRDDRGQLLARERAGEALDTRDYHVLDPGPYATRIAYRHDDRGRRVSAEHVDLEGSRPRAVGAATPSKRVRYQYEADRLVAIEWTRRSDPRLEAWRLVYEGPRLVQVRYETDGRVAFLHDYDYDATGQRTKDRMISTSGGNPTVYELHYDPAGRLIGRDLATRDQPLPQQRIEYDAAGRVVRFTDRDLETRYAYDDAGRLVRNEHLSALAVNRSLSELTYGHGCTAANTARLRPDPASHFLDDLLGLEDERWIRVHPEWDGDVPWF